MYLKRYLFTLVLYYLPYALLVRWQAAFGARPDEAHAAVQGIMATIYVLMSLNLVVFRPQARFAFESWTHRTMRWVLYLTLYLGLVMMPALLLLRAGSDLFRLTLAAPVLLFLGMLHSPKQKDGPEPDDGRFEDGPKRWMTYVSVYVIAAYAGAMLISTLAPPRYLNTGLVLLFLAKAVMGLWMIHRLTVARPNVRFASLTGGQRWKRCLIYTGLYLCLVFVLPRVLLALTGRTLPLDLAALIPLLASAAYGPTRTAFALPPRKPRPLRETEEERLQRRMRELLPPLHPDR
ncbi:MAG: hypothetical protein AB7D39_15520 [Pseudodesulfovibrio sp.]|uniref:hypothetical protein n=1 Tax=Pseudodesulfovibrio sp. TaxID=2035812 RepID=UPI003D0DBB59